MSGLSPHATVRRIFRDSHGCEFVLGCGLARTQGRARRKFRVPATGLRLIAMISCVVVVGFLAAGTAMGQDCTDLYNPNQVLDFHVTMDPLDWDDLRSSCPGGLCGPRSWQMGGNQ